MLIQPVSHLICIGESDATMSALKLTFCLRIFQLGWLDFYAQLKKVCLTVCSCMINEVIIIMGENHWGSDPGAHLITNFLSQKPPSHFPPPETPSSSRETWNVIQLPKSNSFDKTNFLQSCKVAQKCSRIKCKRQFDELLEAINQQ